MSYCGLAEPNSVPLIVFSNRVMMPPDTCTVSFSGLARPVMTTVPPLPITLNAFVTTSSSTVPTVTSAWSAIWPQVSSLTLAAASSAEANAWVAPDLSAVSRLESEAPEAVDHGGVARPHAARVVGRGPAGRYPAADQHRGLQRQPVVDLDHRMLGDRCPLRKRAQDAH